MRWTDCAKENEILIFQLSATLKNVVFEQSTLGNVVRKRIHWIDQMRSIAYMMHVICEVVQILLVLARPTHCGKQF